MDERVVYNEDDGRWYVQGDDPWVVRIVPKGSPVKPLRFAIADTYEEAFQQLFGHASPIPAVVRGHRNVVQA